MKYVLKTWSNIIMLFSDKCIGACYGYIACIIDNSGEPQCKQDTSGIKIVLFSI